jgi:hypothetical protein
MSHRMHNLQVMSTKVVKPYETMLIADIRICEQRVGGDWMRSSKPAALYRRTDFLTKRVEDLQSVRSCSKSE